MERKVFIVEGKTDQRRLEQVIAATESIEYVLTYGTLGEEKLEELILPLVDEEVYVLVDADHAGNKLRKQLKHYLPNAHHLYTRKMYGEVASTPLEHIAYILDQANIEVNSNLLEMCSRNRQK